MAAFKRYKHVLWPPNLKHVTFQSKQVHHLHYTILLYYIILYIQLEGFSRGRKSTLWSSGLQDATTKATVCKLSKFTERKNCLRRGQISVQSLISTTLLSTSQYAWWNFSIPFFFNPTREFLNFSKGLTKSCKKHEYLCLRIRDFFLYP